VQEYYIPALQMVGFLPHATVADLSDASLEKIKRTFLGINTRQVDFRRLLEERDLSNLFDAVLIALPNVLHEEASLLALDLNLHVLCEKPLTLTRDGCLRLARRAEKAGRILAVSMVRRLLPSIAVLRRAFHGGIIGELDSIDIENGEQYAWLSDTGDFFRRENGGVLADMGVHYLDLAGEFAGELMPLRYWDDCHGGVESNAVFELQSTESIPVRLTLSRTRKLRNRLIFKGNRGELIVEKEIDDSCLWRSYDSGAVTKLLPIEPFSGGNWPHVFESCFAQQLYEFQESIETGKAPRVDAINAASTMSCIEWAYSQQKALVSCASQGNAPDIHALPQGPIMVTGGTGFIGSNLVKRLCEFGFDDVVAPVRNYRTCAEVARFPIKMPRLDLLNYEEVKAAIKGRRWVFHLAYGTSGQDASRITIEGTQNIVEAAIYAGCESVVVLSSMYVFGRPQGRVDESWPYCPAGGEYGKSKALMERWCLKRGRSSGNTRIVILNPSCVYGPGGKTYSSMPVRMAREGAFCWIEGGKGTANYTFVENLLDAMLLAAMCDQAHGERIIVNDGTTTWHKFLKPLLSSFGEELPSYTKEQLWDSHKRNSRVSLLDAARIIASDQKAVNILKKTFPFRVSLQFVAQHAPSRLQKIRELRSASEAGSTNYNGNRLPPLWLADLFGHTQTVFSAEKAHRLLNWKPRVDLEEGQKLTVEWLQYSNFI